jgi:hypothetical protein
MRLRLGLFVEVDPETAALKLVAYAEIWNSAAALPDE